VSQCSCINNNSSLVLVAAVVVVIIILIYRALYYVSYSYFVFAKQLVLVMINISVVVYFSKLMIN